MDFENAVIVASFPNLETAEAAVSLLASEGVEAVISSDGALGELPNLELARGVRVYVQSEQAEFAKALLKQGEDDAESQ
jgi:hypothetical protein